MQKTIKDYAKKILKDSGCDIYSYGNSEMREFLLQDLKEAYPDGMEYPYIDVANAILAISKPRPIVRKKYKLIYNTENDTDGIEYDSLEMAKDAAIEILVEWMIEEQTKWKNGEPTEEQKNDWNYMVHNCYVEVFKYNKDMDEYEEYWEPSYEDEKEIGWEELT